MAVMLMAFSVTEENCINIIKDFSDFVLTYGPDVIKICPCSTQLSMKFQIVISLNISINSAFFLAQISPESYFSCS